MNDILGECLFPIILGSNTASHACVRRLDKRYGVGATVLTGKRALTLRFLPRVRLISAPPTLSDEMLLTVLRDLELDSGSRVPLLLLCDEAYGGFVMRNRPLLEGHFILRKASDAAGEVTHLE